VLTELLVAGLLAAFLMLGLIQMAAGVSRGLLLIESLSQSQQGGRFAVDQIRDGVMAAGFHPSPWDGSSTIPGLGEETSDGGLELLWQFEHHSRRQWAPCLLPARIDF
jgi:Tfp pilus assembly protein PilW